MKKFSDYTDPELLTLGNDQINDAIRLEAIDRGIKPPVTLSEALRRSEWRGYKKPAEAIRVFRIRVGYTQSDFGWLDEQKATAAFEGLVELKDNYSRGYKLQVAGEVRIETVFVGTDPEQSKAAKFEEYAQDDTEFDKIAEECMERLSKVRQADYNKRVNGERRAEYMRLANGDEQIARNFWAKAERTAWPEVVE